MYAGKVLSCVKNLILLFNDITPQKLCYFFGAEQIN